jgi:hypothetical protein
MAEGGSTSFRRGFQGSETSRAEVTVYSFGDEPGIFSVQDMFTFHGPTAKGGAPTLVSVTTSKALGVAAGTFSFDIKVDDPGRETVMGISDDDWVDIVMTRHGIRTHVMRGQVEDIRRETAVGPTGATIDVMRISGRDFGRIFDLTPIWFDILTDGALGAGAVGRMFDANRAFFRDPATTVETILSGFLRELRNVGRGHWDLPPSLPGVVAEQAADGTSEALFIRNCCFFDRDFTNYPERSNTIDFSIFPGSNQSIWNFMLGWADLPICEIYTELLAPTTGDIPGLVSSPAFDPSFGVDPGTVDYPAALDDLDAPIELVPDFSAMAVVFRDRPFPTISRVDIDGAVEKMEDGPWFERIPMIVVPPQHIVHRAVGRSGLERRNAFYAAPRLLHELSGGYFDFNGPLWNPDDMKRHGFRRHDVVYDYTRGADAEDLVLTQVYKQRIRDFHCINHLFLNGTITLGYGRPDIRIGTKLRIFDGDEGTQETYYVETVQQTWSLVQGVRTSVGVTRGFVGADAELVDVMNEVISKYRRPAVDTGKDEPQPEPQGPPETDDADSLDNAERYAPFTAAASALFAPLAGGFGSGTWGDPATTEGQALHTLLKRESGGYVGRPNYTYGVRARKFTKWAEIHAELKAGRRTATSSATGLGQLILRNVDAYYPSGRSGIGVASEEAYGMLAYIRDRFGSPTAALRFHLANGSY